MTAALTWWGVVQSRTLEQEQREAARSRFARLPRSAKRTTAATANTRPAATAAGARRAAAPSHSH
jgi:hypothetical protein